MRSLNFNFVLNTLRFDLGLGFKLSNSRNCTGSVTRKFDLRSKPARGFHTTVRCQSDNEDITLLPSPQEVSAMLRKNEYQKEFPKGPVKSYDSNQLASNSPIEDTRSEALCTLTSGLLLGVYDGHAGPMCAQVISKRLLSYIAAAMLPQDLLQKFIQDGGSKDNLIESFNDRVEISEELKAEYEKSFQNYLKELTEKGEQPDILRCIESAMLKLDGDLSREVLDNYDITGRVNPKTLAVALSGAVACVCYVDGPDLYVANVGDCNVAIGSYLEDKEWHAKRLSTEHNSENFDELKRIWNEHPPEERNSVVRRDRLLGELAPLRSLGDYRFKWPATTLKEIVAPLHGQKAIPANYHTPPYLSAKPDLLHYRLSPKDRFIIIGSDGLWDTMSSLQAVKLVGEHMKGKLFFNPLKLPNKDVQLGDIDELLVHRHESLRSKPEDRNAATHLIRHAIGGTEYGLDQSRLAHLLSLSPDVSRMFRDDITVTVVFFDSEFLWQCPS